MTKMTKREAEEVMYLFSDFVAMLYTELDLEVPDSFDPPTELERVMHRIEHWDEYWEKKDANLWNPNNV